jgi:hypothetical protein
MAPLNATQKKKKNPTAAIIKRSKNVALDWKYYTTGWCGDYIGKTLSSPPPADRCSIFLFLLIDSNIINERIYKKGRGRFFFVPFFFSHERNWKWSPSAIQKNTWGETFKFYLKNISVRP